MSLKQSGEGDENNGSESTNAEALSQHTRLKFRSNHQLNHIDYSQTNHQEKVNINEDMNDDNSSIKCLVQTIDRFIESLSSHGLNETKQHKSRSGQISKTYETLNFGNLQEKLGNFSQQGRTRIQDERFHFSSPNNMSDAKNIGFRDNCHDFSGTGKIVSVSEAILSNSLHSENQSKNDDSPRETVVKSQTKRIKFPRALHKLLEDSHEGGHSDIVSWHNNGRSFRILDADRFVSQLLPLFFKQTNIRSFQRQLSLYGFRKITKKGEEYGSYCHASFIRGNSKLTCNILRKPVKANLVQPTQPQSKETDLSSMSPVGFLPSPIMSMETDNQNTAMSDIEINEEDLLPHIQWDDLW